MELIDTHCHILPGVDDGPADMATSLSMARLAAADGTSAIVATPHVAEGSYSGADLDERVAAMEEALVAEGIPLRLYTGAEVPMSLCLSERGDSLKSLTLAGGSFLLMETAETTFDLLARAAHQIRLSGLYPVLAHPERVGFVREQPQRLVSLTVGGEVFCQITAASIDGRFGKAQRRSARELLELGAVHLVASDAHRPSGSRAPGLSSGFESLSSIIGETAAKTLMVENPQRVLNDEMLESISINQQRGGLISRLVHLKRK